MGLVRKVAGMWVWCFGKVSRRPPAWREKCDWCPMLSMKYGMKFNKPDRSEKPSRFLPYRVPTSICQLLFLIALQWPGTGQMFIEHHFSPKSRPRRWSHVTKRHMRPPSGSKNSLGMLFYKHATTFGVGWTPDYTNKICGYTVGFLSGGLQRIAGLNQAKGTGICFSNE